MSFLPTANHLTIEDAHENGFKLLSMYKLWHINECVFTANQEVIRSLIQEMQNELDERFIESPTDIDEDKERVFMNNDIFILNVFKKMIRHDEETLNNPDVFLEIEKWARSMRDKLERDVKSYYVLVYDEEHHEEQRTVYQPIGLISKDEAYDILTNLSFAKTNAKMIKISERDYKDYVYIIELNEAAMKLSQLIKYNYSDVLFEAYSSIRKKKAEIRKKVGIKYDYAIVQKFNNVES